MEIVVAVLVVALVAAVALIVMQRRTRGAGGSARPRGSPLGRQPRRSVAQADPMAAAVHEHARATDPREVVAAEQRLRAQAGQVAGGLTAEAHRNQPPPPVDAFPSEPSPPADPYEGELPGSYEDRRHDGRRAENWTDPRSDDRAP